MSHHVTSCNVTSRLATSCHVMPRHVVSRHVTSCHVTSCYVMSRRKSRDGHTTNAPLSTDFFHTQFIWIKHDRVRWLSRRLPIPYRISGIRSSLGCFNDHHMHVNGFLPPGNHVYSLLPYAISGTIILSKVYPEIISRLSYVCVWMHGSDSHVTWDDWQMGMAWKPQRHLVLIVLNTIFVSSHMYPENPERTRVIECLLNMGYVSDTTRTRPGPSQVWADST